MGMPEPYFGGTEDIAFSETSLLRDGSFSQGDYIIKTAYASTDVSSSNFENTIDEVEDLVKNYNCLLYTSPSPRDTRSSRMPSSA